VARLPCVAWRSEPRAVRHAEPHQLGPRCRSLRGSIADRKAASRHAARHRCAGRGTPRGGRLTFAPTDDRPGIPVDSRRHSAKYEARGRHPGAAPSATDKHAGGEERVGPRLPAEQFSAGIQTKIGDVNELIITRTNELIDRTDDNDPQKPELIYRLAELFNEKRQYYDFEARSLDERYPPAVSAIRRKRCSG
jgi:hypothetical protein